MLPEDRFNAKCRVLLNQAAEIVAQQFAQDLIDHSRVGLTHDGIAELPFDRTERGFHIAALMIMG